MKHIVGIFFILFMCKCQYPEKKTQALKSDTIVFHGSPKNTFREVLGNVGIKNQNDEFLTCLFEDSSLIVKADPGNLDLKIKLVSLSNNLTITPNGNKINEFIIKPNKLNPDSIIERAVIELEIDTSYNRPVFIRRDFSDDPIFYRTDHYMKWKALGTEDFIIKRNIRTQ